MLKKKKKKEDAAPAEGEEASESEAPAAEKASGAEGKEGGEGGDGEVIENGEAAPKKGKKKLIIIAGAVVLLLVIGAGLFFSGVLGGGKEEGEHGEEAAKEEVKLDEHGNPIPAAIANAPVYYELPQFLVNLNSPTGRVSFLKMAVTLELRDQEAVAILDANKPRVVDSFNTYLRELRPTDIQGSAGIYRLRNELLTRLNSTVEEGIVKDILFGEIIVQ